MVTHFVSTARRILGGNSPGWIRLRQARVTTVGQVSDQLVNVAVRFVSIPLAISILGREEYGVWLTLVSLVAWFSMSDLGLPSALVNPLAEAIGKGDSKRIRELISTTAFMLGGIGIAIACSCAMLASVLPMERILGMSNPAFNAEVRWATIMVVALNLGTMALRLVDVMTLAMQKGYWSSVASIVGSIASLAGMFCLKLLGGNLVSFALVITLPTILGRIVLWCFIERSFGADFLPHIHCWSRQALKSVGAEGFLFFAGTWGELLVLQTPNIIIAQLLGAATVPLFAIPYQIFYSAYVFLSKLASPLWPAYAEARAKCDWAWIRRTHWRVMRESLFLAITGFLMLGALCGWFVKVWAGPIYAPSIALSFVFAVHFIQWTWNYVFVVLLTGLGFIRMRTLIVLAFGFLDLLLSIVFAKLFGLVGVAAGMLIAMLVTQTWFLPWITFSKARWIYAGIEEA